MVLTDSESDAVTENSDESDYMNGFVCLTKLVREQYMKYLERLLEENVRSWRQKFNGKKVHEIDEVQAIIKQSVNKLEQKAIKSCMMAQIYQQAMRKIIVSVRRDTQNKRLEKTLQGLLDATAPGKNPGDYFAESFSIEKGIAVNSTTKNFSGDGHDGFVVSDNNKKRNEDNDNDKIVYNNNNCKAFSLHQKIDIFQEKINRTNLTSTNGMFLTSKNPNFADDNKSKTLRKRCHTNTSVTRPKEYSSQIKRQYTPPPPQQQGITVSNDVLLSFTPPLPIPTLFSTPPPSSTTKSIINEEEKQNNSLEFIIENSPKEQEIEFVEDDDVARELALLFGDEKTDLDEIFGIDPNSTNDDPQMNSILQEIENATKAQNNNKSQKKLDNNDAMTNVKESIVASSPEPVLISCSPKLTVTAARSTVDLSNSIWPCEIYYQKRKLSASLCRLLDEDLRWHDLMKWKFLDLFGEDSDDEFAMYSPSIDMDDVLKSSCIKRVSPWIVQCLMKPLNDGIIANRFLFKKLARKLANIIIMRNQYPDKAFVKETIEDFFCIKPSIQSIEDLEDI